MYFDSSICPECGEKIRTSIGQVARGADLMWYRSMRCDTCNFSVEEDGRGRDLFVRNKILESEGDFFLITKQKETRSRALLVVRHALNVNYDEIQSLREVHSNCVAQGTKVEMDWLSKLLQDKEIATAMLSNSEISALSKPIVRRK